jgi:DNA-binding NtrC family response regulator
MDSNEPILIIINLACNNFKNMATSVQKLLIVDDDEYIRLSLKVLLDDCFEQIETVANPNDLKDFFRSNSCDVVLLDMNFVPGEISGREGLKWLEWIRTNSPEVSVVVITAYADIELAVEAIRMGALDFVVKPWQNEKLIATVNAAIQLSQNKRELKSIQAKQKAIGRLSSSPFDEMIGNSSQIRKVFETITKVGPTDANVLILGENGTGKELVARAIHKVSERKNNVFITVDVGAIPESLFESELFGHQRGAFTDAKEERIGRFETASGGTLFLDEIGNLPLNLQSKLLSAIQNRQIFKLGSTKPIDIDVRLICATNGNLNQMIQQGGFRQDLLYRINTVEVNIPPLRDRADDIPLLVYHFTNLYCKKYSRPNLKLPDHVTKKLQKYHWPGNVRELKHSIERAVILSDNEVLRSSDFLFPESDKPHGFPLENLNLENIERWTISECLKKHQGNVSQAAMELGITRGALYRRFERYGL